MDLADNPIRKIHSKPLHSDYPRRCGSCVYNPQPLRILAHWIRIRAIADSARIGADFAASLCHSRANVRETSVQSNHQWDWLLLPKLLQAYITFVYTLSRFYYSLPPPGGRQSNNMTRHYRGVRDKSRSALFPFRNRLVNTVHAITRSYHHLQPPQHCIWPILLLFFFKPYRLLLMPFALYLPTTCPLTHRFSQNARVLSSCWCPCSSSCSNGPGL